MLKKKKILFIITGLVGGGAERALLNLLGVIDKNAYDINLLVIFADRVGSKKIADVNVCTLFPTAKSIVYKLAKHLYINLGIDHLIRHITLRKVQKKYDTMVSFLEGDSLLYHSFLYDNANVNVSWVHTDFVENHWSKRHFVANDEYKAYVSLSKLVFVSEYAQKQFAKVFDLPDTVKQYVCANVINVDEIKEKSLEPIDIVKNKFTICSVGRLEEVKGYDMVINAAKILKERNIDVDFWILGKGSQEKQLKEQLRQSQCEDMVHFLGYKDNPYPYIKSADVYLSSSYAEGLPLVLCEAQCLEKPIIATKTIGALQLLKDGDNRRLIDISAIAIADAVDKWLTNNNCVSKDDIIFQEYHTNEIMELVYQEIL
jgi:glycosyltransferase involved in cell wall biosynthesis